MRRSLALVGSLLVVATACTDAMVDQRKIEIFEPSIWGGDAPRRPPAGTVAREAAPETPPELTEELLARGRERHAIFCAPCHGAAGYGDGIVVRRGFTPPPAYHEPALREATDRRLYEVIRDGQGRMAAFAADLAPRDRWAVVAWIRALQLSQHAPLDLVPEDRRAALEEGGR